MNRFENQVDSKKLFFLITSAPTIHSLENNLHIDVPLFPLR